MSSKFDKLQQHIAHEYEAKGISREKAEKWGAETAAKVAREKAKKGEVGR